METRGLAVDLGQMPFLESVTSMDALALNVIRRTAQRDYALEMLMGSQRVRDGINDRTAGEIVALGGLLSEGDPRGVAWLDARKLKSETRAGTEHDRQRACRSQYTASGRATGRQSRNWR